MKTIISALALVLAAPVAAQSAPATSSPHAGHGQHHGTDHSQHQGMGHSQHQGKDHCKHQGDCCKDQDRKACCEKAARGGKMMPCCEGKAKAADASAEGHEGHDH